MSNRTLHAEEKGNTRIIILLAVGLLAVAGLAYLVVQGRSAPENAPESAPAVSGETVSQDVGDDVEPQAGNDEAFAESIKPGNPVVAKVNGQDVSRMDVFGYIQTLPPNARQMPVDQLFPAALEQVINARIVNEKTTGVTLDSDPEVKRQLDEARKNIVRNVYLQKQIEARLNDARVAEAYEEYKASFPDIGEVRARHILVQDEKLAKDLISQLDNGADFAELAKANSTDGTAESGGEIGYFAEGDVIPEFSKAAFSMKVGEYTQKPVKTEFGYHVIQVEEQRKRPPATMEQIRPFIEAELRRVILNEVIDDWRKNARIERFDINGEKPSPVAAAAGSEG